MVNVIHYDTFSLWLLVWEWRWISRARVLCFNYLSKWKVWAPGVFTMAGCCMVKLLWRRQRWHLLFTDMRSSRSSRYWFGEVIFDYHSVQTFKNRPDNTACIHALNALRCAATLKDTFFIRGVLFFILIQFCYLIFSGRGPNYFDWSLNFWIYLNMFLDVIK